MSVTNDVSSVCKFCDISFKNKESLRVHLFNKHSNERSGDFKCSICGSVYSSKGQLQKHHTLKHEPSVQLSCDICEFVCFSKNGLRRHHNRVHGATKIQESIQTVDDSQSDFRKQPSAQHINTVEYQNPIVSLTPVDISEFIPVSYSPSIEGEDIGFSWNSSHTRERVLEFHEL